MLRFRIAIASIICGGLLLLGSCQWETAQVTDGPFVGQVGQHAAEVWVRTNVAAKVIVEYSTPAHGWRRAERSTDSARDFTAKLELTALPAQSDVFYRIRLNGELQPGTYRLRTAPADPAASVKVAVLSDFDGHRDAPALSTAMIRSPDLLVLLGDLDHRGPRRLAEMRRMYRDLRDRNTAFGSTFYSAVENAQRQPDFLRVWDDHDFGVNNADRTFTGKADAMRAFDEYFILASRENIAPERRGGLWQMESYGCADFFLLDVRAMRDPIGSADGPGKSILGAEQKAWLRRQLLAQSPLGKSSSRRRPSTQEPSQKTAGGHISVNATSS